VPAVIPNTLPPLLTVPIAVLLLDHVPPVPLVNVIDDPTQTVELPVIADGTGFTVSDCVT
jgi:hypothetical protein